MAIAFDTGTISQPDAGSVGLSMAEKIRDVVVAHAAWELVEEFTAASGTVRWYVFKCLAASSGLPRDFHVIMGRTLSTGELRFAISENYTVAGHMMQYFAPNSSGTSLRLYDADGRHTDTFSLATTPFTTTTNQPRYQQWVPSGTSTKYWIIVDTDRLVIAFNGASNGWVQVGAFEPLTDLAWPEPLFIAGSHGNGSQGSLVSNPAVVGANTYQGALIIDVGGTTSASFGASTSSPPFLGVPAEMKWNDKLQSNQRAVAECGIIIYPVAGQADYATVLGFFCGKQKKMRYGMNSSAPAGFAFGDAYALNGTLWVPYLPSDTRIWDTGVAAA